MYVGKCRRRTARVPVPCMLGVLNLSLLGGPFLVNPTNPSSEANLHRLFTLNTNKQTRGYTSLLTVNKQTTWTHRKRHWDLPGNIKLSNKVPKHLKETGPLLECIFAHPQFEECCDVEKHTSLFHAWQEPFLAAVNHSSPAPRKPPP